MSSSTSPERRVGRVEASLTRDREFVELAPLLRAFDFERLLAADFFLRVLADLLRDLAIA